MVLNRADTDRPAGAGINQHQPRLEPCKAVRQRDGRQNPDVVTAQELLLHASMAFYNWDSPWRCHDPSFRIFFRFYWLQVSFLAFGYSFNFSQFSWISMLRLGSASLLTILTTDVRSRCSTCWLPNASNIWTAHTSYKVSSFCSLILLYVTSCVMECFGPFTICFCKYGKVVAANQDCCSNMVILPHQHSELAHYWDWIYQTRMLVPTGIICRLQILKKNNKTDYRAPPSDSNSTVTTH